MEETAEEIAETPSHLSHFFFWNWNLRRTTILFRSAPHFAGHYCYCWSCCHYWRKCSLGNVETCESLASFAHFSINVLFRNTVENFVIFLTGDEAEDSVDVKEADWRWSRDALRSLLTDFLPLWLVCDWLRTERMGKTQCVYVCDKRSRSYRRDATAFVSINNTRILCYS